MGDRGEDSEVDLADSDPEDLADEDEDVDLDAIMGSAFNGSGEEEPSEMPNRAQQSRPSGKWSSLQSFSRQRV